MQSSCSNLVEQIAGRTVLVAGGTGFLGLHLTRKLTELGASVHVVSRNHRPEAASVRWWRADLSQFDDVQELLKTIRPDVVYSLATHGVGRPDLDLVIPTCKIDLGTTVNLLTASAELGIGRMVVLASLEQPIVENGDVVPSSPYGAAKWAASVYAQMFHTLYKLPVATVRPFMVYGPGQPDFKIIPYVTTSLLEGKSPRLSSCERLIDWIYVDDVITGMIAAATAAGIEGTTIDLGSGRLVPTREVIEKIAVLVGSDAMPLFGAIPDRPNEKVRTADLAPARLKLGWLPTTSLEVGLSRTVAWYRANLALCTGY
jgi:UDP-glucose 4-epimerase